MNSLNGIKQIPQHISRIVFNYCKTLLLPRKKNNNGKKWSESINSSANGDMITLRWKHQLSNKWKHQLLKLFMFFVLTLLRGLFSLSFFFLSTCVWEPIFQSLDISSVAYIAIKLELAFAKRSANDIIQNLARTSLKKSTIEESNRVSFDKNHFIKIHRFKQYCSRHRTPHRRKC